MGERDDRFIWPEMLRVISEVKPAWVVGENVAGLLSMENGRTLERILLDLENEGYQVEVFVIPAFGVESVHRRDRVWIIGFTANPGSMGCSWLRNNEKKFCTGREAFNVSYSCIKAIWDNKVSEFNREHDGIPSGLDKDRIRALGNAIVPQVVYEIFKAIDLK